MSVDKLIIELQFFMPSKVVTTTILDLNGLFLKAAEDSTPVKSFRVDLKSHRFRSFLRQREVRRQQRNIAERLYRYLASVARNEHLNGRPVNIWECISQGMSTALGFPSYEEIDVHTDLGHHASNALRDLTIEFREWLIERPDGYQAPWGQVWLVNGDQMQVTSATNWCPVRVRDSAPFQVGSPVSESRELGTLVGS